MIDINALMSNKPSLDQALAAHDKFKPINQFDGEFKSIIQKTLLTSYWKFAIFMDQVAIYRLARMANNAQQISYGLALFHTKSTQQWLTGHGFTEDSPLEAQIAFHKQHQAEFVSDVGFLTVFFESVPVPLLPHFENQAILDSLWEARLKLRDSKQKRTQPVRPFMEVEEQIFERFLPKGQEKSLHQATIERFYIGSARIFIQLDKALIEAGYLDMGLRHYNTKALPDPEAADGDQIEKGWYASQLIYVKKLNSGVYQYINVDMNFEALGKVAAYAVAELCMNDANPKT